MKFEVVGKRGGQSRRWEVEAANETAVRQKALKAGIEVQAVRSLEREVAAHEAEDERAADSAAHATNSAPKKPPRNSLVVGQQRLPKNNESGRPNSDTRRQIVAIFAVIITAGLLLGLVWCGWWALKQAAYAVTAPMRSDAERNAKLQNAKIKLENATTPAEFAEAIVALCPKISGLTFEGTARVSMKFAVQPQAITRLEYFNAMTDIAKILMVARSSQFPWQEVEIIGIGQLNDSYGRPHDETVISGIWTRSEITRINFENANGDMVMALADTRYIHPMLRE